jgi:copper(I)-binding protein
MKTRFIAAGLAALLLQSTAARAAPVLQALHPWSRPAAAGATGAGYLTLVNKGSADTLVAVESPVASRVEMHASSMTGGVMRMSPETRVSVPAGGEVRFAPGGRHLMLLGLKKPLKTGDRVPATLRFASGAELKVELVVSPTAPAGEAMDHMDHMDHAH